MFLKLFSVTVKNEKYQAGQIWKYQTRKGEEESTLTIVNVEKHKKLGTIINIYVGGLKIKHSNTDHGFSDKVQHLPFSKEAIDKSVTKLIGKTKHFPTTKMDMMNGE